MARGEGVKRVSDLFGKYKQSLQAPEKTVQTAFVEVVGDVLGVAIAPERIQYTPSQKIIYLQTSGPLSNEIRLHKAELILHLKGRLGPKNAPKDII